MTRVVVKLAPFLVLCSIWLGMLTPAHAHDCSACRFYLVTMYPGDGVFSGFGHVAIRIENPETGDDDVYDYGTYEAEDPFLFWKFLVGTLPYYCQELEYQVMVDWYKTDFSGIQIQQLNLTQPQKAEVYAQLIHDSKPENSAYRYHHFYNNCSTKIRDLLDRVTGGELSQQTKGVGAGKSLRDLINASMARPEFGVSRWLVFGLLNWTIDEETDRWNQMFLPWYLAREVAALEQTELPGAPPLVSEARVVVGEAQPEPSLPAAWPGVVFIVLVSLMALIPAGLAWRGWRMVGRVWYGLVLMLYGLGAGFYGTLLLFSWPFSPYPDTWATITLLAFHPLHWMLLVWGVGMLRGGNPTDWIRKYLRAGIALSTLLVLIQWTPVIPQRIWPYTLTTLFVALALEISRHTLEQPTTDR